MRAECDDERINDMARRAERTAREVKAELMRVRYNSAEHLAAVRVCAHVRARALVRPPRVCLLSRVFPTLCAPAPGSRPAARVHRLGLRRPRQPSRLESSRSFSGLASCRVVFSLPPLAVLAQTKKLAAVKGAVAARRARKEARRRARMPTPPRGAVLPCPPPYSYG